jgi:hypothetical protein
MPVALQHLTWVGDQLASGVVAFADCAAGYPPNSFSRASHLAYSLL